MKQPSGAVQGGNAARTLLHFQSTVKPEPSTLHRMGIIAGSAGSPPRLGSAVLRSFDIFLISLSLCFQPICNRKWPLPSYFCPRQWSTTHSD
jgi:hypothetical protein